MSSHETIDHPSVDTIPPDATLPEEPLSSGHEHLIPDNADHYPYELSEEIGEPENISGFRFAIYEAAKRGFMEVSRESGGNGDDDGTFLVHTTASAAAGALAAAITTPLDVVKASCNARYREAKLHCPTAIAMKNVMVGWCGKAPAYRVNEFCQCIPPREEVAGLET
ncbi:Mitochondrial carrier domain superfamily [Forsythia ovata]|uniref:Mitochondrial carrier domain superfamily n=1 Tax=Forsythia ovata TaxID=205694 RepID=A0ABD1WA77_9LAMI